MHVLLASLMKQQQQLPVQCVRHGPQTVLHRDELVIPADIKIRIRPLDSTCIKSGIIIYTSQMI